MRGCRCVERERGVEREKRQREIEREGEVVCVCFRVKEGVYSCARIQVYIGGGGEGSQAGATRTNFLIRETLGNRDTLIRNS